MFDKLQPLAAPVKWIVATALSAVVLIWFWHPIWQFLGALCAKADSVFP